MEQYLKDRMDELRAKYKETGEIQYEYRHREIVKAYEHWVLSQINQ